MKTSHEIARALLALPDAPLYIEGWCRTNKEGIRVALTDWGDGDDGVILCLDYNPTPPAKDL